MHTYIQTYQPTYVCTMNTPTYVHMAKCKMQTVAGQQRVVACQQHAVACQKHRLSLGSAYPPQKTYPKMQCILPRFFCCLEITSGNDSLGITTLTTEKLKSTPVTVPVIVCWAMTHPHFKSVCFVGVLHDALDLLDCILAEEFDVHHHFFATSLGILLQCQ